jgi:hypothetical protein
VRRALLVVLLALAVTACSDDGDGSAGGDGIDDPCALLTDEEVTEIMGAEPFAPGSTPVDEEGVCNWETDPVDRDNYFYVTLRVESLEDATEGYPHLRTAIDEGTNVEIIDIDGIGDEAYATKNPLSGAGTIDGITMALGDTVLDIGWQSQVPVERDSARSEHVLDIAQKALSRL